MMSFDAFRKDLIRMHEEDDNSHALQWFLNDIFESAEKNLVHYCERCNKKQKEGLKNETRA